MNNFIHFEKRLNPYKILGSERTPHQPTINDDVCIRVINAIYDDTTKLILVDEVNNELVYKFDDVKEVEKGYTYEFNIGKFEYNQHLEYYFVNSESKSLRYHFTVSQSTIVSSKNAKIEVANNQCNIEMTLTDHICKKLYLAFTVQYLVIGEEQKISTNTIISEHSDFVHITNTTNSHYATIDKSTLNITIYDHHNKIIIENLAIHITHSNDEIIKLSYTYHSECDGIYGTGERYNHVNQKGLITDNMIFEQFTNQDRATYFPIPFYFTPNGYGIMNNTKAVIEYDFANQDDNTYTMDIAMNSKGIVDDMYILFGQPKDIISKYLHLSALPQIPPEWSFGIWVSANRWNSQKHIDEQIEIIKKHDYPATALVIEAWSDERTFYIFNEAQYNTTDSSKPFAYDDFSFKEDALWTNPKKMIKDLQDIGVHLILWQIPVLKTISQYNDNVQHNADVQYAVDNDLCVKDGDDVYALPDFWFDHSYLPDFTNPETLKWWFDKRQYLLDIGVDGFKTDGGEFIYKDNISFFNGDTGRDMKNQYASDYIRTYSDFVGKDGVLFSRASYLGNQNNPIHWAGDQLSTWEELRSVMKAGLSMGLSGVPYWSFDIGGFAGELPSSELYIRSTQAAVFTPVMQWHSEPMSGQFQAIYPRDSNIINDRSPWNIAEVNGDSDVMTQSVRYANLRVNLLPYIICQAQIAQLATKPMMCHLVYNYPDDINTYDIDDQFMLGDLLVAPIMIEGSTARQVYLPEGQWIDLNTGDVIQGGKTISVQCPLHQIPVYLMEGKAIALNLNSAYNIYESAPKSLDDMQEISMFITGSNGEYQHYQDSKVALMVTWDENGYDIVENNTGKAIKILTPTQYSNIVAVGSTLFNEIKLNIYE